MTLRATALLLALFGAACAKKAEPETPVPVQEAAAQVEMIDYDPPARTFACRAPAHWTGEEATRFGPDEITFVGPASVSISISRYPNASDKYADAEEYAKSWEQVDHKPTRYVKKDIGGRTVIVFSRERPLKKIHSQKIEYLIRQDVALVPAKGGFFAIEHSAPANAYRRTLPVFEAMVRSFRPKN